MQSVDLYLNLSVQHRATCVAKCAILYQTTPQSSSHIPFCTLKVISSSQLNLGTTVRWFEGYSSVLPSSFWHSAICFLVWVTGRLHPSDTYDFRASCKKASARSGSPFLLISTHKHTQIHHLVFHVYRKADIIQCAVCLQIFLMLLRSMHFYAFILKPCHTHRTTSVFSFILPD